MKITCLIILVVVCLTVTTLPSHAEDILIGEWWPMSTSSGGLNLTRMYETNGVVSFAWGAVLNLKYEIDDGQLILSGMDCPQIVTIVGQSLTLTEPNTGKKQELTRVNGSEGDGIIGKWTGDHYTGAKQIMHFTTNMNCYFIVPMISITGTFKIKGDILTEEVPNKGKTIWKFKVADDILTMTKIGETKVVKYKRKK